MIEFMNRINEASKKQFIYTSNLEEPLLLKSLKQLYKDAVRVTSDIDEIPALQDFDNTDTKEKFIIWIIL
jgi:hypothetical protein